MVDDDACTFDMLGMIAYALQIDARLSVGLGEYSVCVF